MLRYIFKLIAVILFLSVSSVAFSQSADSTNQATIKKFVAAFNAKDTPGMLSLVAGDIEWFSISADSLATEVSGKERLEEWLTGYLKSTPSARSESESMMSSGSFVAVRERAFWMGKKGERSQVSIAVYEIRDDKIRRVWYFPAEQLER